VGEKGRSVRENTIPQEEKRGGLFLARKLKWPGGEKEEGALGVNKKRRKKKGKDVE